MASTPTNGLRLELIADGEASNTWGMKTNTNLSMLDRAVSGYIVYAMADGNNTLSSTDYLLADWHNMGWKLTGALTADAALRVPAAEKVYIVENATTGAFTVTVKTLSGTGVIVPQGQRAVLLCDGTNVVGTVLQPYSANNASIGAISTAGFLTRKANGTFVSRTIEGTDEQITVTQGLGEDSNPKLSLNTNLIAPGSLKVKTGLSVDAGGIVISAGGLTVQAGATRFSGANAAVQLASSSGFGSMDISGPSGAVLDLKNSESEDFDVRVISTGDGGSVVSNSDLKLQAVNGAKNVQVLVGTEAITETTSTRFTVLKGIARVQIEGDIDSKFELANASRTFDLGVRGGGAFSIRNNGVDNVVISPDGGSTFTAGVAIQAGGLASVGNIIATGGAVNFEAMTTFGSKGITDDSQAKVLFVRNNGNVGINSSIPQLMMHLGSLGTQRNASIRLETGNGANFRAWDFGTNFGEYSFFINDSTAGVRRFSIGLDGRTTVTAGLTVTAGTSSLNGGLTVTGTSTLNGTTQIARAGSGTMFTITNSASTADNSCQVQYNGQSFNVFTRVAQSSGNFDFVNTNYSAVMLTVTQAGACLNATGTYGQLSDERLKDNITDARDYTGDLMKLRVVDYSLKADNLNHADKLGFVAQEVQAVLPELVVNAGTFQGVEDALAVSTSNLTPMIIKALQEMNRRLEAVEHA